MMQPSNPRPMYSPASNSLLLDAFCASPMKPNWRRRFWRASDMTQQNQPPRIVQSLQTPSAVVTYRAVVGLLMAATAAMVGFVGSDLMDGQRQLNATMVKVQ